MSPSVPRHMRVPPQVANGWFAVLRAGEVVPGKATPFRFMNRELVCFRDERGEVAVLDAICPHFGGHLGHGGTVHHGCVRCPFHALEFDRRGQCVGGSRYPARGREDLRTGTVAAREAAGCVFVWSGPDPAKPLWPLPLDAYDWEGWSKPVTNAGRPLPTTNLFFPTENIIDMQHFVTVHRWDLHEILEAPHVDAAGRFVARIRVTWTLGAQSEIAVLRRLGSFVRSPFDVEFVILEPGIAVATTELTPEQGSMRVRSVIMITPTSDRDCHIRAAMSVLDPAAGPLRAALRRRLGVGLPELLAPLFLAAGTADFARDALVWSHRAHLERPRPLKGDGPIVAYRRWSERFWPDWYEPNAPPAPSASAEGEHGRDLAAG